MPYISEHPRDTTDPAAASALTFDGASDEVWTDPDGLLRQLRSEDPVHWSEPEQAWIITRHADAFEVLRDDQTYSADGRLAAGDAGATVRGVADRSPLPYDSVMSSAAHEDHAHLRRSAAAAFAPASVEALRAPIRELARQLLGDARGDELDAIGQFAQPLALGTTLHLLGVPSASRDAARLTHLAELLMRATQFGTQPDGRPSDRATTAEARAEIGVLLDELPVDDGTLIASLRTARDAGQLSDDDLVALVVFIATVGQAPTAFVLGNGLLALLRNPDQLAALRADPALFGNVIDEAARFDPPLRVIRRFVREDTRLQGRELHAGDQIQIIVTATNRDPAVYHDPNRFDLRRGARNHLGFGWGNHHCLGAPVARAIAEEAFAALLPAFPDLVASGRLELMTGELAGPTALGILGRPGARPALLEAARAADVVSRSVGVVPPNHACPCGSGRKAKRCHSAG